MAKFQIPDHFKPGFAAIINLNQDQVFDLIKVINNIPIGASPKTLIEYIKRQVSINDIGKIALTLSSIVSIRAAENTSNEELAQEIAESYSEGISSPLPQSEFDDLYNKLLMLFSSFNNLNITYKAHNLILSNDKIYRESKIISDIRIVFNEDIKEGNRHAVIVHKLRFKYENDDDYKEFYISLDTSDLKELKVQVERALEKDNIIKEDYKDLITFIDIE